MPLFILRRLLRRRSLVPRLLGPEPQLPRDPFPPAQHALTHLGVQRACGRRGTVLEVRVLPARQRPQLVDRRPLRYGHAVAVEVRLELALAPGLEDVGLGGRGRRGEVAGGRGVRGAAGGRGRGVGRLGGVDELVAGCPSLGADLLGG